MPFLEEIIQPLIFTEWLAFPKTLFSVRSILHFVDVPLMSRIQGEESPWVGSSRSNPWSFCHSQSAGRLCCPLGGEARSCANGRQSCFDGRSVCCFSHSSPTSLLLLSLPTRLCPRKECMFCVDGVVLLLPPLIPLIPVIILLCLEFHLCLECLEFQLCLPCHQCHNSIPSPTLLLFLQPLPPREVFLPPQPTKLDLSTRERTCRWRSGELFSLNIAIRSSWRKPMRLCNLVHSRVCGEQREGLSRKGKE